MSAQALLALSQFETIVSGLDHPEGIAYAPDGSLYASGEAGQVYRVNIAGKTFTQFASTGGFGLGIAVDAESNLYVCDMGVHAVVRVMPNGATETYTTGTADNPLRIPNYPVFDATGNLYVSDSRDWGKKNGLIYRIRPGGEAGVWSEAASGYTNGMALHPDGQSLYVVESIPPQISRIPIAADGSAGTAETIVALPETVPDGIAFDANGTLYITCYAPDRIYRFSSTDGLEILFDDWSRTVLNAPTNIAFVGASLDRLAAASIGGYGLVWADIGVRGAPVHTPRLG